MREWWPRLMQRVGRRGAALLFFGLLDAVYAYSLASPTPEMTRSPTWTFIASVAPLWAWCAAWAVASVTCLVHAFRLNDGPGFAAAIVVKSLWGTTYLAMAVLGVGPRAYVGAVLWLCLAAWVWLISTWPEAPTTEE